MQPHESDSPPTTDPLRQPVAAALPSTFEPENVSQVDDLEEECDVVNQVDDVADWNDAEARAIAAGRRATACITGEERLNAVFDAAEALEAVPRSRGFRGRGDTRYQALLKAIGISRETAREWKNALALKPLAPAYAAWAKGQNPAREITIAGLVDFAATSGQAPASFQSGSAALPTTAMCPTCGYEWTAKSKCARCEACPKCKGRWWK